MKQYKDTLESTAYRLPTGHVIEFEIGQIVYLKTDDSQLARMVTGINLGPNKSVMYFLSLGADDSLHYGIEIDNVRDVVKATAG